MEKFTGMERPTVLARKLNALVEEIAALKQESKAEVKTEKKVATKKEEKKSEASE